jgi:hypothetical protein
MKIVLVYRPELRTTAHRDDSPFEGIEIIGVANDEDQANEMIDRIRDEQIPDPPPSPWQFLIDTV